MAVVSYHNAVTPKAAHCWIGVGGGRLAGTYPLALVTWKHDREANLLGKLIPLGSLQSQVGIHSFIHSFRTSIDYTQ